MSTWLWILLIVVVPPIEAAIAVLVFAAIYGRRGRPIPSLPQPLHPSQWGKR